MGFQCNRDLRRPPPRPFVLQGSIVKKVNYAGRTMSGLAYTGRVASSIVKKVNYAGRTGSCATEGEQCAFDVYNRVPQQRLH